MRKLYAAGAAVVAVAFAGAAGVEYIEDGYDGHVALQLLMSAGGYPAKVEDDKITIWSLKEHVGKDVGNITYDFGARSVCRNDYFHAPDYTVHDPSASNCVPFWRYNERGIEMLYTYACLAAGRAENRAFEEKHCRNTEAFVQP